ncbi:Peptide transporter family 1 [Aphelenchoides fujianensis]|nr:Peptide transporter family 1 [Aphelenchoides fujianensis]
MLKAWPKSTLLIIGNEFAERFSFYGMRTVLTLYLLNVLRFSEDNSITFYNSFTVPAAAMIVATILFAVGTPWYRKPKLNRSNVFADVFRVIFVALKNRIKNTNKTKGRPCLDYYLDTHQAVYMDCRIVGSWVVPPDQMQVANAAMIILLIPIFQFGVVSLTVLLPLLTTFLQYPLVEKCVKLTILRKQVAGGVIATLAYVVCGIVQIQVEKTMPVLPADGRAFLSVINGFESCSLTASIRQQSDDGGAASGLFLADAKEGFDLLALQALENDRNQQEALRSGGRAANHPVRLHGLRERAPPASVQLNLQAKQMNFVYVDAKGWISGVSATKKPTDGNGEHSASFLLALDKEYPGSLALHPCNPGTAADFVYFAKSDVKNVTYTPWEGQAANPQAKLFSFQSVRPGKWRLYYTKSEPKTNNRATKPEQFDAQYVGYEVERLEQGGVYLNVLSGQKANPLNTTFRAVEHNSMSILWQLPQIFIITTAEILISITGNEFSYTQAPPSMKSFASSLFLLTVCAGDQMITIVRLFHIGNQTVEFFLWAGAMLLATVALALLAIFYYEYVDYENLKDKQTGARTAAPSIASTTPAEQAPANVPADSDGPETANVNAAQ